MSRLSRLLGPAELENAARIAAKAAAAAGVRAAVLGGYAMQLYGSPRLTADLDFAADGPAFPGRRGRALGFGGVRLRGPNGVPLDWIVRDDEYAALYSEAVEKAGRGRGGYLVVRPEHLAAMKLAARRPKDHEDLVWLLQRPRLVNRRRARRIVARLVGGRFAADEFDAVAMEADWRKARERRAR